MKRRLERMSLALGLVLAGASGAFAGFPTFPVRRCGPDAAVAGTVCLDRYEASVWRVPNPTAANAFLVRKIQMGLATKADLAASGAVQLGTTTDDYAPCAENGQNSANEIFAVSLPSVIPSANITWFQAQEACANAGKRLPTNAEWQVGVTGTPDPGPDNGVTDCNTFSDDAASPTGSRSACVSARGAFDMVGNLAEWVTDWSPPSTNCPGWGGFSDDFMCLSGASTTASGPGARLRGGDFLVDAGSGPLTVDGVRPSFSSIVAGFRCAR